MSKYAEQVASVQKRMELLEEELGLLTRLQEIESGHVVAPKAKVKTVKATKTETPAIPAGDTPKKKRGRPPKNPNAPATPKTEAVADDGEKKMKLPQLLEQIGREAKRSLKYDEIVQMVKDNGYTSAAKDYNNMVYQCLLKLVKGNVFTKTGEGKDAEYTIAA